MISFPIWQIVEYKFKMNRLFVYLYKNIKSSFTLSTLYPASLFISFLLARLESAYSLISGSHKIWGQGWWGHLGPFMISRPI